MPWGLLWERRVPDYSIVAMDDIKTRWRRALEDEKAQICESRGRASMAGAIIGPNPQWREHEKYCAQLVWETLKA